MDVSKFDYEIDPEVEEHVSIDSSKEESRGNSRYKDDLEEVDDYVTKTKGKKKIKSLCYREDYERSPKNETYYIVYNNVEFSILAKKIGFTDKYKQIVLDNNGTFYNFEDEFFDSRDAERVVEILKEKFSDREWFIQTLAASIEQMFDESTLFDDLTFDLIQKRFFMLRTETLYEAIAFLANK